MIARLSGRSPFRRIRCVRRRRTTPSGTVRGTVALLRGCTWGWFPGHPTHINKVIRHRSVGRHPCAHAHRRPEYVSLIGPKHVGPATAQNKRVNANRNARNRVRVRGCVYACRVTIAYRVVAQPWLNSFSGWTCPTPCRSSGSRNKSNNASPIFACTKNKHNNSVQVWVDVQCSERSDRALAALVNNNHDDCGGVPACMHAHTAHVLVSAASARIAVVGAVPPPASGRS